MHYETIEPDELILRRAHLAARTRHPSRLPPLASEAPERPESESGPGLELDRASTEQLAQSLAVIHDYFRLVEPDATGALENYLHEHQLGLHAEVLLDQLETWTQSVAEALHRPDEETAW